MIPERFPDMLFVLSATGTFSGYAHYYSLIRIIAYFIGNSPITRNIHPCFFSVNRKKFTYF